MKLKDILKTDTDNKGWLRVFKKLGADAEMLKYVNENISKSGGGNENDNSFYIRFSDDCGVDSKMVLFLHFNVISYTVAAYNTESYHNVRDTNNFVPLNIFQVQIYKNKYKLYNDDNEIQPCNSYEDFINILYNFSGEENIDFEHYFPEITAEEYWSFINNN